jgi:chromate transport protein ChrA
MLNATERKALTLCTFTAACICFAPAQIVSGLTLLIASFFLYRWDQRLSKKEAEAAKAAQTGESPPPPDEAKGSPAAS